MSAIIVSAQYRKDAEAMAAHPIISYMVGSLPADLRGDILNDKAPGGFSRAARAEFNARAEVLRGSGDESAMKLIAHLGCAADAIKIVLEQIRDAGDGS